MYTAFAILSGHIIGSCVFLLSEVLPLEKLSERPSYLLSFSRVMLSALVILLTVLHIKRDNRDNLGIIFPYFCIQTYVVSPHLNRLAETVLMRGHNICFCQEIKMKKKK